MTRKYKKRGGAAANFESSPGMFSSPYAKVPGVGCAGTKSNVVAANSVYQPYSQLGGTAMFGMSKEPLSSHVTGPSAGHAAINKIEPKVVKRDLQMGGGTTGYQPKGCGSLVSCHATGISAGGARRRRRRSRRGGGTTGYQSRPTIKPVLLNKCDSEGVCEGFSMGGSRRRSRRGGGDIHDIGSSPVKKLGGSRRRRRSRGGGRRGTKSKTHRGKNYETRKSSKRYRSGKFKKYLRGRKTMLAPDFPFVGGSPQPYSNIPYTPGYSAGTQLPPNLSALANPVPYKAYNHCRSN